MSSWEICVSETLLYLSIWKPRGTWASKGKGKRVRGLPELLFLVIKENFFLNGTINTEKLYCIAPEMKVKNCLFSGFWVSVPKTDFLIKFLCRFMKEMTQHSLIQKYSVTKTLLPHEGCSVTHLKQHSSHFLPLPPLLQEYSLCELLPNPQKQKCLWSHKLYGISNLKSLFWGQYSALRASRFPRPNNKCHHGAEGRDIQMEILSQEGLGALMEAALSMATQFQWSPKLLSKLV